MRLLHRHRQRTPEPRPTSCREEHGQTPSRAPLTGTCFCAMMGVLATLVARP